MRRALLAAPRWLLARVAAAPAHGADDDQPRTGSS